MYAQRLVSAANILTAVSDVLPTGQGYSVFHTLNKMSNYTCWSSVAASVRDGMRELFKLKGEPSLGVAPAALRHGKKQGSVRVSGARSQRPAL